MKKFLLSTAFSAITLTALAQSGTNSPYSQFGYGKLADQSQGFNRGMNGVGLAFRESNQVNYSNPASYSSIDSLTFVFDVGMSLQTTHFTENGISKNANNSDFEYAVGAFRLVKNVGMSFGFLPYTNVGYNYSSQQSVPNYNVLPSTSTEITNTQTYSGSGGLRQFYIGAGWQTPINGLSLGMNFSYLWGTVTNTLSSSYSDNTVSSYTRQYGVTARSYKLDLGAQYSLQLKNKDIATIGVTYSPGHSLNAAHELTINSNTTVPATDKGSLPTAIGAGLSLRHNQKWLFGLDYTMQKWSSVKFPVYENSNYITQTDVFTDRHRLNAGMEFCRKPDGLKFADKVKYRFGMGYTSPYLKVNGNDGPKEFSMSAGVGLPIINSWNNRSTLNIGVQWQNLSGNNLLTENTFLINIGLTFNERWFAKWKFE